MAADVAEMLRAYDNKISALLPERKWFFPRESGEMCQQDWFRRNFRNLCDLAGICPTGGSVNLYCLRHSFATHRIYIWLAEGKNVNAMIPYLSAYMGHSQISDTCYYIHHIPELLTEMSGQKYGNSADLLPNQRCYSTETIRSYKQCLNLLTKYLRDARNFKVSKIDFTIFNRELILAFLDWLESERKVSTSTRNQ
jgi:site-specific recombinase XerD